jgi:glycosyltransferase involved in cell wall biosynthesis
MSEHSDTGFVKDENMRIGLVAPAVTDITRIFIANIVKIMLFTTQNLYLITANADPTTFDLAHFYSIKQETSANSLARIISYIQFQLRLSFILARLSRKVDFFVFFLCEEDLLPMLTARVFGKKVMLALGGFTDLELKLQNNRFSRQIKFMTDINYTLASKIVVYSPNVITDWNLGKHRNKIAIAHEHFLDFNEFKTRKYLNKRGDLVGYIGRLSEEKGILNFIRAIPLALAHRHDLKFLIVGDGKLKSEIVDYIGAQKLNDVVTIAGWTPHHQIPDCLNEIRLLVLPSFTEGLPNIMLEAMACGTPVLTTPVGSIAYFVKDGQTGYFMENNSPETIAQNILRALNDHNFEQIAKNAHHLAESEFTFEKAVKEYRSVLELMRS